MSASSALSAEIIRGGLNSQTIGREILVLEQTTSTNDAVFERMSAAIPEGLVVFAEMQTAGRGQRSNSWESARGKALSFSILLRPNIEIGESPRLAEWAARAVAETISKELALSATVKMPNDVIIAEKKVAGVLVEMRAQPNVRHAAIIGIGLNVNQQLDDFSDATRDRAISLSIALKRDLDRNQLAVALLKNLDRSYGEIFPP